MLSPASSPRAIRLSRLSAQFSLSSSEDEPSPRREPRPNDHSQVGSVQKFLTKPVPAPAREPSRGGRKTKTKRGRVARKLAEDLKGTSLVRESTEEQSSTSSAAPIDPRLLANSYADFSSDSAKALIAAMEGGKQQGNSRPASQSSQSSCGSNISVSESCLGRGGLVPSESGRKEGEGEEKEPDDTSLTPVDMEVATPVTAPAPTQTNHLDTSTTSTSIIPSVKSVLEGVTVLVDFRTRANNRSASVKSFATKLGAAVSDRLNSEVKHVIIKDGSLAN